MSARSTSIPYLGQFIVSSIGPAPKEKVFLDNAARVVGFWHDHIFSSGFIHPGKEHVVVLALNVKNHLIGWHLVAMGTPTEASFRLAEVFRPVIVAGAVHFVLVHNHPSGDPTPSMIDRELTKKIWAMGNALNVPCVDHVIVADDAREYFSFLERGLMDDESPSSKPSAPPPPVDPSAPLCAVDLIERWKITGADDAARLHNLARRCRDWGLVPMRGTRGELALYGRVEVQAAEAFALGKLHRRRVRSV